MGETVEFSRSDGQLLLNYQPSGQDPLFVIRKLDAEGKATVRKIFTFESKDLVKQSEIDPLDEGELSFVFGKSEGDYYRIERRILSLNYDLLISKDLTISHKTFMAATDISIFRRIDALIDEPIIVGGNAEGAIPLEIFQEFLANFPTTTELKHYARSRVTGVLKDYLGTMSDAQIKLDNFLNRKK